MRITLRDGKSYNFECLGLTDTACEFFEVREGESGEKITGKMLRIMQRAIMESLSAGGHSPEEIQAALGATSLGHDSFGAIIKAMLGSDEEEAAPCQDSAAG